jgi:hypothetical protein
MSEYIYVATKDCSKGLFIAGVSLQMVDILFAVFQFIRDFVEGYFALYVPFFVFLCSVVNHSFRNRTVDFQV